MSKNKTSSAAYLRTNEPEFIDSILKDEMVVLEVTTSVDGIRPINKDTFEVRNLPDKVLINAILKNQIKIYEQYLNTHYPKVKASFVIKAVIRHPSGKAEYYANVISSSSHRSLTDELIDELLCVSHITMSEYFINGIQLFDQDFIKKCRSKVKDLDCINHLIDDFVGNQSNKKLKEPLSFKNDASLHTITFSTSIKKQIISPTLKKKPYTINVEINGLRDREKEIYVYNRSPEGNPSVEITVKCPTPELFNDAKSLYGESLTAQLKLKDVAVGNEISTQLLSIEKGEPLYPDASEFTLIAQ